MTKSFKNITVALLTIFLLVGQNCLSKEIPSLETIDQYLNSVKTLKSNFLQISQDGNVKTGTFFLKIPNKIRFEYDPPSNHLVLASGLLLVIIDHQSNSEPQRYLTAQTPIEFLIGKKNKAFLNRAYIKKTFYQPNTLHVILNDKTNPKLGELELVFSFPRIKLIEWKTVSYSGEKTRFLLEDIVKNTPLNDDLFDIGAEIANFKRSK